MVCTHALGLLFTDFRFRQIIPAAGVSRLRRAALLCCASSRLRRLAPFGLPSLTPTARIPRSGPCALRLRAVGTQGWPLPVQPSSLAHHLSATVARGRVSSRRAGPCPRLRLRAHQPCTFLLDAPVRALLTVAGDELRKDGGNEANRVLRADRTEQSKGGLRILESGCGEQQTLSLSGEVPCNSHPVSLPVRRCCVPTIPCRMTKSAR